MRKRTYNSRKGLIGFLFAFPAVLYFLVVYTYPFIQTFLLSFFTMRYCPAVSAVIRKMSRTATFLPRSTMAATKKPMTSAQPQIKDAVGPKPI